MSSCSFKNILQILPMPSPHFVGDGFKVHPLFGSLAFTNQLSPFLMLDYGAPTKFDPTTKKRGVGIHPHRGFETVTIAFQGEVEHGDSIGNKGIIGPGDIQWMTAASGIVHEEYHSRKFAKEGGIMEMVQLWVNLPSHLKMSPPKYQPILSTDILTAPLDDNRGQVRVIAGQYQSVKGPASTHSPMNIWDVHLNKEATFQFEVESGYTCIIFSRNGKFETVTNTNEHVTIDQHQVVVMDRDNGNTVQICNPNTNEKGIDLLILSGEPLNEPIAARGPFVMNTEEELRQAMIDYQTGNFIKQ